jgi:hypothetical protein
LFSFFILLCPTLEFQGRLALAYHVAYHAFPEHFVTWYEKSAGYADSYRMSCFSVLTPFAVKTRGSSVGLCDRKADFEFGSFKSDEMNLENH